MTSLSSVSNLNKLIKEKNSFFETVRTQEFQENLKTLNIDWNSKSINQNSKIYPLFVEHGLITEKKLTPAGVLFCGRISIDFKTLFAKNSIVENKFNIIQWTCL